MTVDKLDSDGRVQLLADDYVVVDPQEEIERKNDEITITVRGYVNPATIRPGGSHITLGELFSRSMVPGRFWWNLTPEAAAIRVDRDGAESIVLSLSEAQAGKGHAFEMKNGDTVTVLGAQADDNEVLPWTELRLDAETTALADKDRELYELLEFRKTLGAEAKGYREVGMPVNHPNARRLRDQVALTDGRIQERAKELREAQ